MDPMAALLSGPRAREAFLLRSILTPPWSIRVEDRAPLTLVAVVEGAAWMLPQAGDAVALACGDVAVVQGPGPYTVADDPATPPQVVIGPAQECTTVDGRPYAGADDLGVRTWGNSSLGSTVLLTGTYQSPGEISRRLLAALPPLIVQRSGAWDRGLVAMLRDEVSRDGAGQEAVLDRLLDLLLVAVVREWFARPGGGAPRWYAAQADRVVGPALRLLHDRPDLPWTVGALADEVGVSRAALARRFTDLVGEPPMGYLTTWRLSLAADLLLEPEATVGSVARRVGYGDAFALSAAFKRERGVSPSDHRRLCS